MVDKLRERDSEVSDDFANSELTYIKNLEENLNELFTKKDTMSVTKLQELKGRIIRPETDNNDGNNIDDNNSLKILEKVNSIFEVAIRKSKSPIKLVGDKTHKVREDKIPELARNYNVALPEDSSNKRLIINGLSQRKLVEEMLSTNRHSVPGNG
jgi:hypothetical protein